MKFTNLAAFEKHLFEASPQHLSRVYMVVAPVEFERRKIIETIIKALRPDATNAFDAQDGPIEKVIAQLNTLSLFGSRPLTILNSFDKLKKADQEPLAAYLQKPSPFSYLILSGSSLKSCDLYQKAQKEVILLDLSEEKPWDKEKRLREYLAKEAVREGKTLSPDLIAHLFSEIGPDMASLNSELFKLVSYVGCRPKITLDDAKAICASYQTLSGWQLAEGIIWDSTYPDAPIDTSVLIPLIGQLRYHLQVGYQICEGTAPYLKAAQADKFMSLSRKFGPHYFKKGLEALFELELSSKSSGIAPDLLLDVFIAKLNLIKQHARPSAQSPKP